MGKIEIDLADLGLGEGDFQQELYGAIVTRAASLIVKEYRDKALADLKHRVETAVEAEVRAVVVAALAKPIQRTTPWGEARGETTTVLEIAREALAKYMQAQGSGIDRRHSDGPRNLKELVDDVVRNAMRTELAEAVADARERVRTAIGEAIGPQVTEAIQAAVRKGR